MAFTFNLNLVPTSFADAVFTLKTQLKAAGWVHQASGDGLAAFSTTPGNVNDQITSGGSGANGMDNARAWFVLQQPGGGPRQLCFQRGGSTPYAAWHRPTPTTTPPQRAYAAMAYHPPSGKIILFGGANGGQVNLNNGFANTPFYNDTWEFDPVTEQWTLLAPATTPSARAGHVMAYSPTLGKLVMFGGGSANLGSYLSDTYTWDGTDWTLEAPGASPTGRHSSAMATDPVTGHVIIFGGRTGDHPVTPSSDTWTYDGVTWTNLAPATTPTAREFHCMALHSSSGRVVMFGGGNRILTTDEPGTYTWDGTDWTLETPATEPILRMYATMTPTGTLFPTNGVLFFGGRSFTAPLPHEFSTSMGSDLWTWTGTDWVELAEPYPPNSRAAHMAAFDPVTKKFVLLGGNGNGPNWTDTWVSTFADTGSDYWYVKYSRAAGFTGGAPSATQVPTATDQQVVTGAGPDASPLFTQISTDGGAINYNIVVDNAAPYGWWAGGYGGPAPTWQNIAPSVQNEEACMAYDTTRGLTYMQGGGSSGQGPFNQTIVRGAGGWNLTFTGNLPPNARNSAMCYDSVNDKIWWWGGEYGSIINPQTWFFDFTLNNWFTQPGALPPKRARHNMVYDIARNKVVLFGGWHFDGVSNMNMQDTWEFDPVTYDWTQVITANSPPRRQWASMVYDSVRNEVVLFGGYDGYPPSSNGLLGDTWTYDGTNWTQKFPAHSPRPHYGSAIAFDSTRGVVRLLGGQVADSTTYLLAEEWEWDGTDWTMLRNGGTVPATQYAPGNSNMMVYDAVRDQFVFVNQDGSFNPNGGGTWVSGFVAGAALGVFVFDPVANPLPEDGDPYTLTVTQYPSGIERVFNSNFDPPDAPSGSFINYGTPRQGWGPSFVMEYYTNFWGRVIPGNNGPVVDNLIDGKVELLPAYWYNDRDDLAYGLKGKSGLIRLPAQRQTPSPWTTGVTPRAYIVFDNLFALPWDGATTPTDGGADFPARDIAITTPDQVTEQLENVQTEALVPSGGSSGSGVVVGSTIVRGGS